MIETTQVRLDRLQRMMRYLSDRRVEFYRHRAHARRLIDVTEYPDDSFVFSFDFDSETGRCFVSSDGPHGVRREVPFEALVETIELEVFPRVREKLDAGVNWMLRERDRLVADFDYANPKWDHLEGRRE